MMPSCSMPWLTTSSTRATCAAARSCRTSKRVSAGRGRFAAGLILHEGQLTLQNQGLHLVVDLGVWWQARTGLPLPLGGNVVRRDLGPDVIQCISRLLKESI